MRFFRTKKGFTLIELMIVIAIIGILAAVAVPNFNKARIQAKSKACLAQAKTMQAAVEQYDMDNDGGAMSDASGTLSALIPGLVTDEYLKEWAKCRSTGNHYLWSGSVASTAVGTADIKAREVYCDHHGSPVSPVDAKTLTR